MINIEFESVEEITETLTIVSDSINQALNKNSNKAEIKIGETIHHINMNSEQFKAGMLYGISISKDLY